jgi:histidyl-tRNA synthetase
VSPKFEAPRGMADVLPAAQSLRRRVVATMEEVCRVYGYRRIDTPGVEDTGLIVRTSGEGSDVVQKETYTFTDRGGRSLTLRPEGTAPIARAYVEHGLHREAQPQKLYTIAPMWRYDRPQRGRFREHWQLSVEAIGSADPAIDAEVMRLYAEVLQRLRLDGWVVEVNSIGDAKCRPAYIERLSAWLDQHDAELGEEARQKRATSPLRVFDVKDERTQRLLEDAPKVGESLCDECRAHFAQVRSLLDGFGVPYVVVPTLVRGLDYYTRTTFEFKDTEGVVICGGGRYDGLVEAIGGPATPGIGFGAGIERLELALSEQLPPEPIDVFFVVDAAGDRTRVLTLIADLRARGVSADTDYAGRSTKGQFTQAGRLAARTIVVVDADGPAIDKQRVPFEDLVASLAP